MIDEEREVSIKEVAKEYVGKYGFSVIPVHGPQSKSPKSPCISKWAEYQTRKPRVDEIEQWYKYQPDAGVGIVTGMVSGVIVLDIDGPEGEKSIKGKIIPRTPTVRTGKGTHYYFKHSGHKVKNGTRILPGVDIKADGGYVVAPPSIHENRNKYTWIIGLDEAEIAPMPEWLQELVSGPRTRAATPTEGMSGDLAEIFQSGVEKGMRNDSAARLAGHFIARRAHPEVILQAMLDWNKRNWPPMGEEEVQSVVKSILQRESEKPVAPAGNLPPTGPTRTLPLPADRINAFNRTDSGNAELFAAMFGGKVRYDHKRGRWLIWQDHYWGLDTNGELDRMALEVARIRYQAVVEHPGSNEEKGKLATWSLSSESGPKRQLTLDLARSERPITDDGEGWDANPWLLAVNNGVIDLKTGELLPGRPEQKITRHIALDYQPEATNPTHPSYPRRWTRFLKEIFKNDEDLVAFIQRAVGYSLTGSVQEQCLFLCYGKGANGKSVFLSTLRHILGPYAENTGFATFEQQHNQGIPNDLAALDGARLVTASEVSESSRLNEARIKSLTGNDPMTARFLHGEFFTFSPVMKIWLAFNHKPRVNDDSLGFWRRVRLIPFEQVFDPKAEPNLADTLKTEAIGILAWAVKGCLEWQEHGLEPPAAVQNATKEYEEESDPLAEWIAEKCFLGADQVLRASEGYNSYKAWCEKEGMKEKEQLSMTTWGRKMVGRFEKDRTAEGRIYKGVGLKPGGFRVGDV